MLGLAAAFAAIEVIQAGWDLPSSHGWENDGIAPRDLFGGLAQAFTPGAAHRYPVLHYLWVGLIGLPVLLFGVLQAPSFDAGDVRAAVLSVSVMTGLSLVAKLLSVAMGFAIVLVASSWARAIHSPAASVWCAIFLVTCRSFAYYTGTSNLDVPYLFWTVLAIDRLAAALALGGTRDLIRFGALAAAAIATKDQAYAAFASVGIGYLVLPLARAAAGDRLRLMRRLGSVLASTVLSYLVLSGSLVNPGGLWARVRIVTGTNSQDWRSYERSLLGLESNVLDLFELQSDFWWSWPMVAAAWCGVMIAGFGRSCRVSRARSLLPFVAGLGSLLFFTLVVARAEARFVLPLGVMLSVYGGITCADLAAAAKRWIASDRVLLGAAVLSLLAAAVAWSGARGLALAVTQWNDARREVEAYLADLPQGAVVETYGLTVYQPRFNTSRDARYRVQRIDKSAPERRNPLPGVEELRAEYMGYAQRGPAILVVPEAYSSRFLERAAVPGQVASRYPAADPDAARFFRAIHAGRLPGYRVCKRALPSLGWLAGLVEPVRLHSSIGPSLLLLCRESVALDGFLVRHCDADEQLRTPDRAR